MTPVLAVGISSDVLYPVSEVKKLAGALPNARYETLEAPPGTRRLPDRNRRARSIDHHLHNRPDQRLDFYPTAHHHRGCAKSSMGITQDLACETPGAGTPLQPSPPLRHAGSGPAGDDARQRVPVITDDDDKVPMRLIETAGPDHHSRVWNPARATPTSTPCHDRVCRNQASANRP